MRLLSLSLILLAALALVTQSTPEWPARDDGDEPFARERPRLPHYPAGFRPARARLDAIEQMDRMMAEQRENGAAQQPWTDIGPRPTTFGAAHWGAWTSASAVDPTNSQIVYIGNPGSGVWKTSDGGTTWNPTSDNAAAMGIGAIAVAPSNANVVYAGTGAEYWDYGVGVLKSTDKGATWNLLSGPFQGPFGPTSFFDGGFFVISLAVHPQNSEILLAGAFEGQQNRRGIYRSTNGGSTWTQVFSGGKASSLVWNPLNANIVYAAIGDYYSPGQNGIYKSSDGGITWTLSENGVPASLFTSSDSILLSLCAANPNIIYASLPGIAGGTLAVLKTIDGGANWTQLPKPPASRAFDVVVHPQNPNVVFVGDVTLYRSIDGGQTWNSVSAGTNGVNLFGDFRSLTFSNDGSVLYVGDDGGMWRTTDALLPSINWTPLNDTLETVLFYPGSPISIHPTDPNVGFGGAQDLGVLKYSGTKTWQRVVNCDGGTTLIDPSNTQNVYATCNGIIVYKSATGGAAGSWVTSISGINTGDRSRFVPTIAMDPQNSQRLLYGTYRLYQSVNGAQAWSAISPDLTNNCYAGIASISVSPVSSNTVYVGSQCAGTVYVSTNSLAGSPTWTDRSAGLPNNRDLTRIVADLTDPLTAYVTISGFTWTNSPQGHVFRTQNGGANWTDISGNLPNIPANDLVIDPDLPGTLYLATDIGVFSTSNGGNTWTPLSTGLPHAYVQNLRLHQPSRILRAATLGRGMWDLSIPAVAPVTPAAITSPAPGSNLTGSTVTFTWSPGTGPTGYWLDVGTAPFVGNIASGSVGANTSKQVSGLPLNGSTVYVTLYSNINGSYTDSTGAYYRNAYTYTAGQIATITSPAPGSTLSASTATFTWTAAAGATEYWLDVGTAPSVGNIAGGSVGLNTSRQVSGLPVDGSTVYATLYSKINGSYTDSTGAYLRNAYTYTAMKVATITSPAPGSTLSAPTATFSWAAVAGATEYWLDVGTLPSVGNITGGSVGANTSKQVSGLPVDGSVVYATLYTKINGSYQDSNGAYLRTSYTYLAARIGAITSPAPGSTLAASIVTFNWSAYSGGAAQYWLDVGTSPSQGNIFGGNVGSVTSQQVTGLPVNGSPVYVTLYTRINGSFQDVNGAYIRNSYTFASPSNALGAITNPAPGATLAGASATFNWTAGAGVTAYWLDVGTAPFVGNITAGNVGTATSKAVSGLPLDGSTVYATLYSLVNGAWQGASYTYTSYDGRAALTAPANLHGSSATFTWTPGTGAAAYWLDVGTAPGQGNISAGNLGTATSKFVSGIPTNGSTLYVNLYSNINGVWLVKSYTYTTGP